MSLFGKLFGKKDNDKEMVTDSQKVIDVMIRNADICMEQGDYSRAFYTYKQIIELQPNVTAMYNLGSLYAQGKGVDQNYLEGAYWFHQAKLAGDEQAGKLCTKCMMDMVHQNLNQKTLQMVYDDMIHFAAYLYPEENSVRIAVSNLFSLAEHHLYKKEFEVTAKLCRAAAEYGNCGEAQDLLASLYQMGAGVEKDNLVSLYWFDKAVDNHIEGAKQDRDGLFKAYKNNLSSEEFCNTMQRLSQRCTTGDKDISKDAQKAAYWREIGEGKLSLGENSTKAVEPVTEEKCVTLEDIVKKMQNIIGNAGKLGKNKEPF